MDDPRAAVITVSDSVSAGTVEDVSGPVIVDALTALGFRVTDTSVVPDGIEPLANEIRVLAATADLIVTTGGTGLSRRDLTPEATASVIDRPVPGLSEAMRSATFGVIPHGMLSRGIAGIVGTCLVVNLPGSVRAVREGLDVIGPALRHGVEIASGHHGRHD
ncbi:MAG: MogA/MoaB family molybdenum cofactor biosynthesis protein [Acidimicrobiia bacterium]